MTVDKIGKFVKVCEKLDQLRFAGTANWGSLGENIHKNDKLKASTRLLLFWLCSMIDQFYPYERIWTYGERGMLKLLESNPQSFSEVESKITNRRKDHRGNTLGDIPVNHGRFVLVRDDYKRIKNTFDFLSQYGKNHESLGDKFVQAFGELVASCYGKNGILKMTYFIDGWLFSNSNVSDELTLRNLDRFRDKPRKRLWMFMMFLRKDPSLLKLLKKALNEVYGENDGKSLYGIWNNPVKFDPNELELPSDMWNKRLFTALIGELTPDRKGAKRIARELGSKYGISPSVFDVTFELGANKCKHQDCTKCPFGDNKLCHKGEKKNCSIDQWLFPYYEKNKEEVQPCNPERCPIAHDWGKNLCTRKISKEIKH